MGEGFSEGSDSEKRKSELFPFLLEAGHVSEDDYKLKVEHAQETTTLCRVQSSEQRLTARCRVLKPFIAITMHSPCKRVNEYF